MMLICFSIISTSEAQQTNITGTWNIIEFSIITEENNDNKNEQTLKDEGPVWDLIFMENGRLKQASNMRSGTVESWEGDWNVKGEHLILLLQVNNQEIELVYTYLLNDNVLTLERGNPMKTMKIVTKFRRQ